MDTLLKRWVAVCGSGHLAYTLLGVHKSTWSLYFRGERDVPLYITRSIEAHLMLHASSPKQFRALVDEHRKDAEVGVGEGG